MRCTTRQLSHAASLAAVCASVSLFVAVRARAQSNDLGSPTPVYNSEIAGRIAPLDLGDPRQTRHFYTFNARPGDLELTVEANNLDGDIELFTAAAMRPLAQLTLYSGLGSAVTRTVFFRADSAVILRVQARSPNDAEGTYRIRLGGTFAPSTLPPPDESASATATPAPARPSGGTRRVNSIGARVEEPKVEAPPAAERAETTPAPSEATTTPTPATTAKTAPARNTASSRTTPARRGAARRGATPRATTKTGEAAKTDTTKTEPGKTETKSETTEPATGGEPAREETANKEPAAPTAPAHTSTNRARANRSRGARTNAAGRTAPANGSESSTGSAAVASESSGSSTPASSAPPAAGLEAPGARVVLEMRDGTRVERLMAEVRRVAVEGQSVVIVYKNGRVERRPLADVQRMSIEP